MNKKILFTSILLVNLIISILLMSSCKEDSTDPSKDKGIITGKVTDNNNNPIASVTVSIGIAELGQKTNTAKKLIKAADAAAREAKRLGKNRILHAEDLDSGVTQV